MNCCILVFVSIRSQKYGKRLPFSTASSYGPSDLHRTWRSDRKCGGRGGHTQIVQCHLGHIERGRTLTSPWGECKFDHMHEEIICETIGHQLSI